MANVSFNEEQSPVRSVSSQDPYMVRMLIKQGLAKNADGARFILLGLTAACAVLIGFILLGMHREVSAVPQKEIDAALPVHVRQNR